MSEQRVVEGSLAFDAPFTVAGNTLSFRCGPEVTGITDTKGNHYSLEDGEWVSQVASPLVAGDRICVHYRYVITEGGEGAWAAPVPDGCEVAPGATAERLD